MTIDINPFQPIQGAAGIFSDPLVFAVFNILGLLALLIILLFLVRKLVRKSSFIPASLQEVVLLVTVPKEASDQKEQEKTTIESIRDQISVAESWFSTLGGMKAQRGFKAWFFGRSDSFSFEIVSQRGVISFYIAVPQYMRQHMEQQIMAQYPDSHIVEIPDYNIFSPQANIASAYLKFTREFIFPINTYLKLNTDPLNAITNALSKIDKKDGAAIQIIVRSAKKQWHRKGSEVAHLMQEGKTLQQALSKTGLFGALTSKSQYKDDQNKSHTPSPMEQELIRGIEEKTSKAGLECNIRIVTSSQTQVQAQNYLQQITDAFGQFNFYQYGNSLKTYKVKPSKFVNNFIYRSFLNSQSLILNTEELASIFHFPTPFLETPNIRWLLAKKVAPPPNLPQEGLLLGQNVYRGETNDVYLKASDRSRHLYVVGMTGTGKSVLMTNLALQDIRNGSGVCVVDPHGSLAEDILENIPEERREDVIYFNPSDTDRPIGLNMLEAKTPEQQDFAVQEMISIFYKLVTDPSMIGPAFEHNMRNAMLTLMADQDNPGTIAEIPRIFTDKAFQRYKLQKVTDPMVRAFWEQEMAKTSDFHKSEMLGYLISKVGRFIENAMVRNIIGQSKSGFNFREIMDNKKILIVNLAKGTTGEVNSNLLGLIIVAKLQMAALSRTDIPEEQRNDFYLYIDEFQNFITDSISTILAEARKYKLNLILAHQYLGQLSEGTSVEGKSFGNKVRDAVFGNVGTLMSFRIGVEDAEVMSKQFAPTVSAYDLMNIERFSAYTRLLIDNQPVKPFNIKTFPPAQGSKAVLEDIKEFSRWKYGAEKLVVEEDIIQRAKIGVSHGSDSNEVIPRSL